MAQIGYDMLATKDNIDKITLSDKTFENYKGGTKFAYEPSEILFYSYRLGLLSDKEIKDSYNYIQAIPSHNLIDTIDCSANAVCLYSGDRVVI